MRTSLVDGVSEFGGGAVSFEMSKICEKCGCAKNVRRRLNDKKHYFYSCTHCLKLFYKSTDRVCKFCKKNCRKPSGEKSKICWDPHCREIITGVFAKKCFYKPAGRICIFCKTDWHTPAGECANPKCQQRIREEIAKKYEAYK